MGIAELARVTRSYVSTLWGGPGETVNIEAVGLGGAGLDAELNAHTGFASRPPRGSRGVVLPLGRGRRHCVVIATHNYSVSINLAEGETAIYSTSADGKTLRAQVVLDNAGKVKVSNASRSLYTTLKTLVEHLRDLTTVNCVSGSPVTLSPASIALLNADLSALGQLLKD